jgi:hypothetical protein
MVIAARFDQAGIFAEGLAPVATGLKWGYLDQNGKFVWEAPGRTDALVGEL